MARINQRNIILAAVAIAIIVAVGFSGGLFSVLGPSTGLTSGTTLDVVTEFNDVQDQFLTGVFQISSNVETKYTIDSSSIPSEFASDQSATITIKPIKSEQEFSLGEPITLDTLRYRRDNWRGLTSGNATVRIEYCEEQFQEMLDARYPQAEVWDGYTPHITYYTAVWNPDGCRYFWIQKTGEKGRIAPVESIDLSTTQRASLNGVPEWRLTDENNFSDQTPNGYLANLNGDEFHQPIRYEGLWAYDPTPEEPNTWRMANIGRWSENIDEYYTRLANDTGTSEIQLWDEVNSNINQITSNQETTPPGWAGNTVSITNVGSKIITELNHTAGSQYELALNADQLNIQPQGLACEFVTSQSSTSFSEGTQGSVDYSITNKGQSGGEVAVTASCQGATVNVGADRHNLSSGEQISDSLPISATVPGNESVSATCSIRCRPIETENNIGAQKQFSLTINQLSDCSEGQQSDPLLINNELVIYEYDSNCSVASTTRCSVDEGARVGIDGSYVCGSGVDLAPLKKFLNNLGLAFGVGLGIIAVLLLGLIALGVAVVRRG